MSQNQNIEQVKPKYIDPDYKDANQYSLNELINIIRLMRTDTLSNKTKEELKKLKGGLEEVKILDHLRHLIVSEADDDGDLTLSDDLKKTLSKMIEPGNENLLQILIDIGFEYDVEHDKGNLASFFQAIDAKDAQNLREKLKAIGVEDGQDPTPEQLQQVNYKTLRESLNEIGIHDKLTDFTDELKEKLLDFVIQPENGDVRKLLHDNKILQLSKDEFTKAEKDELIDAIRSAIEQKQMFNDMAFQTMTRLESEMDQTYQYLLSATKTIHEALIRNARGIKGGG